MNMYVNGNRINFQIDQESETNATIPINLPDGYSIKSMMYHAFSDNISLFDSGTSPQHIFPSDTVITFPVVNSKSPCSFILYTSNAPKGAQLCITITEFGCIPDTQYFAGTFLPISSVNPDNGDEYKMIPSTQFGR